MLRLYYPAHAWHEGVCSAKSGVANRAQLSPGVADTCNDPDGPKQYPMPGEGADRCDGPICRPSGVLGAVVGPRGGAMYSVAKGRGWRVCRAP